MGPRDTDQHLLGSLRGAATPINLSGKHFDPACAAETLLARIGGGRIAVEHNLKRRAIRRDAQHLPGARELQLEGNAVDYGRWTEPLVMQWRICVFVAGRTD